MASPFRDRLARVRRMAAPLHAFDFLDSQATDRPPPVCVVFGDEPFLRRHVVARLRARVLGPDEPPYARFEGADLDWRDLIDELSTVALFGGGGPRFVLVEDADEFVSRHRDKLEKYVNQPRRTGVLVLEVASWPGNTRLAKAVAASGWSIECRPPEVRRGRSKSLDERRMLDWIRDWGASRHQVRMAREAALVVLDRVGPEFGLLDQELAKLALYATAEGEVSAELVREVVGGWRLKTTWELVDAAADGDAAEALRQLDRLLHAGENPIGLFAQIAWSLRRFAAATRIYEQAEQAGRRVPLAAALEQAGFRKFPVEAMRRAERQLLQLGRERAAALLGWLLEADLALKGTHSAPDRARFMLEQLIVRLSQAAAPPRGGQRATSR